VFANITRAGVFFCVLIFITFPLLANNGCKIKFPKFLTVNDTIPARQIDSFPAQKIIADTLNPADSLAELSDTSIVDSNRQVTVDTLLFSKDSLDAPVTYSAEDSGVLMIPQKQFILYGKANTT